LTPVSTEILPDVSVAGGIKGYTGDVVLLPVITGFIGMTAIPLHSPFLRRVTGNRTNKAECCFCSQKRSSG